MERQRSNRRRGKSARGQETEVRSPFILRKLNTLDVLSEEGLEQIEANADQILAE
ncbi:MAG: trimethylamine methyltransferase family protein, partial [Pseudomonadota bacterium]